MPGILDAISGELAPTSTYARRSWAFIPADPFDPLKEDDRGGTLVIRQQKGRRCGCKSESDTYAIAEQPLVGAMGRSFLLLNTTDPDQPDVYECVVGPHPRCTCKAGLCGLGCKHRDALSALVGSGGLEVDRDA